MEAHSELTWATAQVVMPLQCGELPDRDDHMLMDQVAQRLPGASQQLQLWGPPRLASVAAELVGRNAGSVLTIKRWTEAVDSGASAAASELKSEYAGHSDWLAEAYVAFVNTAGEVLRDPDSNL